MITFNKISGYNEVTYSSYLTFRLAVVNFFFFFTFKLQFEDKLWVVHKSDIVVIHKETKGLQKVHGK